MVGEVLLVEAVADVERLPGEREWEFGLVRPELSRPPASRRQQTGGSARCISWPGLDLRGAGPGGVVALELDGVDLGLLLPLA